MIKNIGNSKPVNNNIIKNLNTNNCFSIKLNHPILESINVFIDKDNNNCHSSFLIPNVIQLYKEEENNNIFGTF